MSTPRRRGRFLYALVDGTVARTLRSDGVLATVGVVLKDENRRTVRAFAEKAPAADRVEAQCYSIIAALEAAKMQGAQSIIVYCPNSAIVRELNGEQPRNPDLMKLYLLIMAHRNRFRRAAIREANAGVSWQPLRLARDYATRSSGRQVATTASLFAA